MPYRTMPYRTMGDRDRRALGVRHGVHASAELFGERLDDDRAQSGRCFGRTQMGLRRPNAVVGNRKPPTGISRLIGNDKLASGALADKSVLERIDDELRDDETDTASLGG